jgi:hypothetical protein
MKTVSAHVRLGPPPTAEPVQRLLHGSARIGMAEAMRISPWAGTPFSRSEEERCFPRTGSPETVSPHGDHLLRDAVPAGRLTHQGCAARTACLREARGRRSRPASVERRPERALHVSGRPDRLRTITSAISVVWRLSNLGTAAPRPLRNSSLAPLQAQSRPRQKPRRPPPRGSRASERTPRPPEVKGERRGPSDANRTLAGIQVRSPPRPAARPAFSSQRSVLSGPVHSGRAGPRSAVDPMVGQPRNSRAAVYPFSHALAASDGGSRCLSGTARPER